LSEIETLEKDVSRLKMEKAILEKAAEIIKKDQGINPENLANKEQTLLIDALREEYTLKELRNSLGIVKSSYSCHHGNAILQWKYEKLRIEATASFRENKGRYGYGKIYTGLNAKGIRASEKVIRRIMSKEKPVV